MCKPIPGNFVRLRRDVKVTPHESSRGTFPPRKKFTLSTFIHGMVDEATAANPDSLVVAFPWDGGTTLCAELPRSMLKGVEL
jgi:hypothetical protein